MKIEFYKRKIDYEIKTAYELRFIRHGKIYRVGFIRPNNLINLFCGECWGAYVR